MDERTGDSRFGSVIREFPRGYQGLGVRVLRSIEHVIDRAGFDQAPFVHDQNAVCDIVDHIQIVGDE